MPINDESFDTASQPNPYAAPAEPGELPPLVSPGYDDERAEQAIVIFAILNLVFATMAFMGVLFFGVIMLFGIYYSGDPAEEVRDGILGSIILSFPFVLGTLVYGLAAVGLYKRTAWGYFFHMAGAILTALSCLGIVYTFFAMTWAAKPGFYHRLRN